MAIVALGAGAVLRDRLEWYDAYADVLVSDLHTRFAVHDARILSDAGPYLGGAIVLVALLAAGRRGALRAEVLRPLAALAVALLWVECLKLAVYRERPFGLGSVQHDSFPSGDTAQVALCVATALHLVALRRIPRDWLARGLALVGPMTAIAIGLSRVYLSRHWVSDVAASLLIGLVFWSAAPRWPASMRKFALAVSGIVVMVLAGPRVVLPSAMAFGDARHFELPVAVRGSPRHGHRAGGCASWRFRTATARYSLLQLEIAPPEDDGDDDEWLDLEIDRDRVSSVPLAAHRRIYALPLPRLTPGVHEVRLQARRGSQRPGVPVFTLARASIEGAAGHVLVREPAVPVDAGAPAASPR